MEIIKFQLHFSINVFKCLYFTQSKSIFIVKKLLSKTIVTRIVLNGKGCVGQTIIH